jgi:hypothetical protein
VKALLFLALAACGGATQPAAATATQGSQGQGTTSTVNGESSPSKTAQVCHVDEGLCGRSMIAEGACADWKSDMTMKCHSLADPIVMDDAGTFARTFPRVVMFLGAADMVKELKGKDLDKALADAGGVRNFLGLPHGAPIEVTIDRDCTRCARSYVAYKVTAGKTALLLMVEGSKLEISQKKD